jgi:hypothetical protein
MPEMIDLMLQLPSLSPVSGRTVVAKFDGGLLSSDGGVQVLREVEQRRRVADRLASCIEDPRSPDQITHSLADIIRFRLLMIAAGYEDGNDASSQRTDPMFEMALGLSPSERELCSQSSISRRENLPDARALLRMGRVIDLVDGLKAEAIIAGKGYDANRLMRRSQNKEAKSSFHQDAAVKSLVPTTQTSTRNAISSNLSSTSSSTSAASQRATTSSSSTSWAWSSSSLSRYGSNN